MIKRSLEKKLKAVAKQYPIVTLTGPRQSGKTTLVKSVFKKHHYISLENPDDRTYALEDPRGFLNQFDGGVILDEVQRAPDLFSYIQTSVDNDDRAGKYILTGSQNFLLLEKVSQSLAGRCGILHLLPLSYKELKPGKELAPEDLGSKKNIDKKSIRKNALYTLLYTGFYPRIYGKRIDPHGWLKNYYQTYLERDVRQTINVGDIEVFSRFVRLCAGRCGQLLNLSSLATDAGISHTTAQRWISLLEASFIISLLRPHYQNYGKRLIKSPKLYFLDSGLLCYLLRVNSPEELRYHAMKGQIFENFVLSELYKRFVHNGKEPPLYFWRDSLGHEIDIVVDFGETQTGIEVKSGETLVSEYFDALHYWSTLRGEKNCKKALIYAGDRGQERHSVQVYPWHGF